MTNEKSAAEAAEIVAAQWEIILGLSEKRVDPAIPRAAYAHPRLRELYPNVSHGALYLSRCTRFPWTEDVGALFPRRGGYQVLRHSDGKVLGEPDTLEEAVDLIAATLPEGCGPAIIGTAADL